MPHRNGSHRYARDFIGAERGGHHLREVLVRQRSHRLMRIRKRVFEVLDDFVFTLQRSRTILAAARIRILLSQHAGRDHIDDRSHVLHLGAESPHAFEFAVCRREVVFTGRHLFGERDDLPLDGGQVPVEDLSDIWSGRIGGKHRDGRRGNKREKHSMHNTLLSRSL